jgi:hypothetical protein
MVVSSYEVERTHTLTQFGRTADFGSSQSAVLNEMDSNKVYGAWICCFLAARLVEDVDTYTYENLMTTR